jgi:signal peptidase I
VVLLVILVSLFLNGASAGLEKTATLPTWVPWLLGPLYLLVHLVVIRRVLRTSLLKAFVCWLTLALLTIVKVGLVFLVIIPYVLQGFIMPSNAVAPALAGPHRTGVCQYCGGKLIIPAEGPEGFPPREPQSSICATCLRTQAAQPRTLEVEPADRFFVNKLLTPRRWDLIAFRSPSTFPEIYAKRLVGLSGEQVVIKDGGLWINGTRLTPPGELAALRLEATTNLGTEPPWGSPARPAQLGMDEYFVVGDFAERSIDSRQWGKPIRKSDIIGVVTTIYYPLSRWRSFR